MPRAQTAAPEMAASRAEAVSRVVQQAIAQGFGGEVLVADGNSIWFERAVGWANRQRGATHRIGQVWRWASVSKQVMAALMMQQVDAGTLSLDDPVRKHLPLFAAAPGAGTSEVTIRQLLQHTSGLANPDDTPANAAGVPGFYVREDQDLDATALAYCAAVPKRPPGTAFEYNNCDTLVLASLLSRLGGKPYAQLVDERIGAPLGLPSLALAQQRERATAVAYSADGQAIAQPRLATFGASGALEGTARDLLAFDRALLSNKLVSAEGTRAMWDGNPRWGYAALGAWAFETPLAGCSGAVRLIERRGDVGGIQVRNILAPAQGIAIIVFTNNADLEFGEIWQRKGLSHDLVSAAVCPGASSPAQNARAPS